MNKVIKQVMDANGDHLYKINCDKNSYAINALLAKYLVGERGGSNYRYYVGRPFDYKETESKYDSICKMLSSYDFNAEHYRGKIEKLIKDWELLKPAVTEDTYYILFALESEIEDILSEKMICRKRNIVDAMGFNNAFMSGALTGISNASDTKFTRTATDNEKIYKSVLILTENFKDNPIQAFIRFKYLCNVDTYTSVCAEILDTYWIYAFSSLNILKKYVKFLPVEKLNIEKIIRYMNYQSGLHEMDDMFKLVYSRTTEYYKEKTESLEKEIDFLKKDIDDILTPGGSVYETAKECFEKNAETLVSSLG